MKVPRNSLCTVRSTVLVVALLAAILIYFGSFSSQLLSIRSSRPSLFDPSDPNSPSNASGKIAHSSQIAKKTYSMRNVTLSDIQSAGDNIYRDINDSKSDSIPDLVLQTTKKGDLTRELSLETNGKDLAAGSYSEINSTSTDESSTTRLDLFPHDSVRGPKAGTSKRASKLDQIQQFASTKNSTLTEHDHDEAEFSAGHWNTVSTPSFKNDTDSTERPAGLETADVAVENGERRGASPIADNNTVIVLPHGTPAGMTSPPRTAQTIRKNGARGYAELSSVQKVEFDLWQARSALRKMVLSQLNSSANIAATDDETCPYGEPRGDVYKNAALFRTSYQEMEQRFKVYTYQEGEEPLVHNGPCKEIYAVEGRFIQELQGDNPYVTDDPEAAHVFFLPFSITMMVTYLYTANSADMSPLLRFVKDYINVVSHEYPYWTRSEGGDHFILSCHDWGPHISRADANLMSKTIRVLCNANTSEGYIPTKDVSLPEIHLVGGEIPAELGGLSANQRTFLAFFAGGNHGPVRPQLFKHWEGKDEDILVYHQVPSEGLSYHAYMKSSKYCVCPGGYEVNSPRIVEAIYNDCVPVVIADNFVLPFNDVLDWNRFSVRVLQKDIPNLKTILGAIPMETYIEMQAKLKQVRHHFLLNQPPQRYDVFHMILHSIWLRRLNIRLL